MKILAMLAISLLAACGANSNCDAENSQNSANQECKISGDSSTGPTSNTGSGTTETNSNESDSNSGEGSEESDPTMETPTMTVTHDMKDTAYLSEKVHFYVQTNQKNASVFIDIGSARTNLQLYDDQTHGDKVAGDGMFTLEYQIQSGDDINHGDITGHVLNNATTLDAKATDAVTIIAQGTLVSGLINSNTTWTVSGSPYIISADSLVAVNKTLTINPGVVVTFIDKHYLEVRGQINSVGSANTPIQYRNADIRLRWESNVLSYNNDGSYNAGPRFEHSYLPGGDMTVVGSGSSRGPYLKNVTLRTLQSHAYNSDGKAYGTYVEKCVIDRILIQQPKFSKFRNSYINVVAGKVFSWDNFENIESRFTNMMSGGDGNTEFTHNEIGFFYMTSGQASNVIDSNNFKKIKWNYPSSTTINNNNILGSDGSAFELVNTLISAVMDAKANYWGPAITQEMNTKGSAANISAIYDFNDNLSMVVEVNYSNWLTSPVPGAGPDWTLTP